MNRQISKLENRIRQSTFLILAGLLGVIASLFWHQPTAFLVFAGVGGLLIVAGISYYMLSLITVGRHPS